jgi:hypothetical protein
LRIGGFDGTITNTSLHDVIQLICMGRITCRMSVKSGAHSGSVYFKGGEIVHAETDTLQGEEALYRILSWELGMLDSDGTPAERETIEESWDFLLMESLRRLEAMRKR